MGNIFTFPILPGMFTFIRWSRTLRCRSKGSQVAMRISLLLVSVCLVVAVSAQEVTSSHFSLRYAGGTASLMKMKGRYGLLMDGKSAQIREENFHFVRFAPDGQGIDRSKTYVNLNRFEFVSGIDLNGRNELVVSTFSDRDFGPTENENPLLMQLDEELNLKWCTLIRQDFDFHGFLSHKVKYVSDDRIVSCFRSKNENPGSFFSDILLVLWDAEGQLLKSLSISIPPDEENLGIQDLEVDEEGNIYLLTGLTLRKSNFLIPATRLYKFNAELEPTWVRQTEGLTTFDLYPVGPDRFFAMGLAFEPNANRKFLGCYAGMMRTDGGFEWQKQVSLDIDWPRNPAGEHLLPEGADSMWIIIPNRDADEQYLLLFELDGSLEGAYWIPAGITAVDNLSRLPSGRPGVYGYGDNSFFALRPDGEGLCFLNLACATAEPILREPDTLPPAELRPGGLSTLPFSLEEVPASFSLTPIPCRQDAEPSAEFALPEPVVCAGAPILLDEDAFYPRGSSSWTVEGRPDTLRGKPSSLPLELEPGLYELTHILEVGQCVFTAGAPLEVLPSIEVDLGEPEHELCPGESVLLQASINPSPETLSWQDGSTTTEQVALEAGTYWIEVANGLGCTDRDSVVVRRLEYPQVQLHGPAQGCIGQAVTLRAIVEGTTEPVRWNTGEMGDSLLVFEEGLYRAEVANACGGAGAQRYLPFEWCRERIYIPNAFSPNGDGRNDFFEVFPELMDITSMQVFNRWGELVYREESGNPRWDGTVRGRPAPTGTYLYAIRYRNPRTGEEGVRSGEVVLLR